MVKNLSFIDAKADIASNVKIGPFCFIGKNVKIAKNCHIHNHVSITGNITIGENTEIYPFASIGSSPQDLKYKGEITTIQIGKNCRIREYVTINPGTNGGGKVTSVGDNCLLMIGTHVAHDCRIGNNVIFANHSTLAGHVVVEDNVVVGALSAIHQFCRIGEGAMIGGMSGVTADVIPFSTVMGNRAKLSGINILGLKRRNIKKKEILEFRKIFNYIFYDKEYTFRDRIAVAKKSKHKNHIVSKLLKFLLNHSDRSYCMPD
ncbi:MAG: acyl-[acyl-carrier-protein]--UDP-N-acetylglucosamine O-acyltransferase [Rickettsiales bacterium]|nr:acyl-[acyl-carrier-protein]--UDP-N-acetylglucosamine O-acyltransferase [Rickettsiales bacterium]